MINQYDYSLLKKYGNNVFISSNVEIRRPRLVTIGSNLAIDTGFYCTTRLEIEDYIHIAPYVTVIGGENGLLKMGNFTTIAAGSRIVCASDGHLGDGLVGPTIPLQFKDKIKTEPVIFENFASIGTNVVVLPGVTLGEGSVVGSNSLVNKSTEPWTIYVGNPAKPIKFRKKEVMLEYAEKLGYKLH